MPRIERKAERYIFTHPVAYTSPEARDEGARKGLTLNICAHGAGILTPYRLSQGDKILLESNLAAMSLPACVRWTQPVTPFLFKAGLQFGPQDRTKRKQLRNLISVVKKLGSLLSEDDVKLPLERVMSEYFEKCTLDGEESLRQKEDLLKNTIESSADGILAVNRLGAVLHSNKRFAEMWRIPEDLVAQGSDKKLLTNVLGRLRDPEAFLSKVRELYNSADEDTDTLLFNDGRIFERYSSPLISNGEMTGRVWSFRDVTKQRRAEESIRKNEEELKSIFRAAPVGIGVLINRVFQSANERMCEMTGYTLEELLNKSARLLYLTDVDYEYVGTEKYRQIAENGTGTVETRWVRKDGTIIHVILSSSPIVASDLSAGVTFTALDITERKRAETELRESESRQKTMLDSIQSGILLIDAETHVIVDVNPAAAKMIGYSREQLLGSICHRHVCPAEVGQCPITDLKQNIDESDRLLLTAGGAVRSIIKTVSPVTIRGRTHLIESFIDITERKKAEGERRLNETRISALLELSRMTDQTDRAITDFALEKAIELTGSTIGYLAFLNEDETVMTMYSWSRSAMRECLIESKPLIYPVETAGLWGEAVRQRNPVVTNDYEAHNPLKKGYPEGHVRVKRHMNLPLLDGDKIVLVAGVGNKEEPYEESDIRELTLLMDGMWKIVKQKRSEEALRRSEEELYNSYSTQALINLLLSEALKNDPLELFLQKALNMMLSIPWLPFEPEGSIFLVEEEPGILVKSARSNIDQGACLRSSICSRVSFGKCLCGSAAQKQEIQFSDCAGDLHEICHAGAGPHGHYVAPILSGGRTLGVLNIWTKEGLSRDATTEEFLQAIANTLAGIVERRKAERDKERLQSQLLQAQKMEAVGTLAGGVAHDFNNILAGILGYTALMRMKTDKTHPFYEKLKIIEQQVESGAELTKQLLGFARGGKYEVKPINTNDLIIKTSDIFGRTKKEITIHRKLQDDLRVIEADSGQIEQVLLNLYVNAWQAMPAGGEMYLETRNVFLDEQESRTHDVKPGEYIKIAVTDTGIGMDAGTQQRIFEPFFTTKDMGKGTGLGLASAYGIIRNHGGVIKVRSEKGHGATFIIYLPASGKEASGTEAHAGKLLRGDETILIVDDERANIDAVKELLEDLGYRILTAQSGGKAIEIFRKHNEDIDLVILDMIMPGMKGKETLENMMKIDKSVSVILSSGYSIDGEAKDILRLGCKGFLQKPFRVEELSERIREVLDSNGHHM
jgi:PAS domain S-box-containing protein